jgi:hypothetical protein
VFDSLFEKFQQNKLPNPEEFTKISLKFCEFPEWLNQGCFENKTRLLGSSRKLIP